tara:strand:- start:474 stop:749 length:276 start_codon:yes stop_codon:yes gene_type:complete
MTEEEMNDLEKNRQAINREQWLDLMRSCAVYHKKQAEETAPVIIGEQPSEEHIMHKVWSLSVQEAVDLISILPTVDGEDGDLPQHTKGPLG